MSCPYLRTKGDGHHLPWYWCALFARQVRPAEHACGGERCERVRLLDAKAAARAAVSAHKPRRRRRTRS